MSPERWEQVTEIYHTASELGFDERREFLETACAGDESLLREVEALLEADRDAGDFIAQPAFREAASLLGAKPDAPLEPGQRLGHYRIISRIGAGGMGEVYLGKDSRLNRAVAIKILPASFSDDPNYLRRFQTEAEAAATLNHPNVATIYSVEKKDGRSFITMEYVEGKTLDASIPPGGFDVRTFLELFIPLADALSHAHEKGVIHRDIKPGNVITTPEGTPKILDFGLAQIDRPGSGEADTTLRLTQSVRITQPGQVFGTPSYMSPEQAEGKPVDHRSDIFSFGVVMYEALTATRPFAGDSYASVIGSLLKDEPPAVAQVKPETPYLLSRLISRCLCKSRRERFQSMNEVRAILEETKAAVEAGVPPANQSSPFLAQDNRRAALKWLFASILPLVALAVPVIYYFRQSPPAESPINFANMTPRRLSQSGNVSYAQLTPDGKSIVYITFDETEGRSLWIRRIEDRNALPLLSKGLRQFWGGIGVSPDGSQVFYILADENARFGTLYRVSSLGGAPRKLVENANDVGSVSPDGQRVLFVRYLDKMQILSANAADGGDERVIYTGEADELFRDPQFSADGKSIFFSRRKLTNGKTGWSLLEVPSDGGGAERSIIDSGGQRIGELAVLKNGKGLLINKTDDVSNLQQLFYVSLPEGREQRITNDLNSYQGISASDDGKTIAAAQNHTAKDIWVGRDARSLRRVTTESNVYSSASFAPDGRIVYDALDNNRPLIWIMNQDGSGAQQLTPKDSFNSEPQVSPDGRYIVFSSDRTGESKIWRMNLDGSSPTLLTNVDGPAFSPVVSPDSRTVWFQWRRENKQVLAKIPLAGGEAVEQQPPFGDNLWSISPDGTRVAAVFFDAPDNQFKVRVGPVEGDEPAKIYDIPASFILKWTPDAKNLLYRSLDTTPEMFSIVWMQSLEGGEPRQFLSVKPDRVINLSQSADGKQLLIVRSKTLTDAVLLTKIPDE